VVSAVSMPSSVGKVPFTLALYSDLHAHTQGAGSSSGGVTR